MDTKSNIKSTNPKDLDDRTILSIQRTILANTRTFSAWMRTGLSSSLAGLAIVKFLGNNKDHRSLVSIIGIIFLIIGIIVYLYSYISYRASYKALEQDRYQISIPLHILFFLSLGLIVTSILMLVLLVFYN